MGRKGPVQAAQGIASPSAKATRLAWGHCQALLLPLQEGSPSSATTHSPLVSRDFPFKAETGKL